MSFASLLVRKNIKTFSAAMMVNRRSYHDKGNGVDINKIDEIDTFEKSIQNRYNDLYLKMHQTSKLTLPSSASQKLSFENSDHSDIEDYEKLYFDSYNAHVMKQQVKEFEQKHMEKGKDFVEACQNKDRAVIGRLFVGKTLFQELEASKILTTAEVAGVMAAKKTSELIPYHLNTTIHKIVTAASLDADTNEVVVTANVENDSERGDAITEAMIACSTALVTIFDYLVKQHPGSLPQIKNIKVV